MYHEFRQQGELVLVQNGAEGHVAAEFVARSACPVIGLEHRAELVILVSIAEKRGAVYPLRLEDDHVSHCANDA